MAQNILIVGAGIIGASITYHAARAGIAVTVLEGSGVAAGASGASFGWINSSFYHDDAHFRLRAAGMVAWRKLAADLPDLPVKFCGSLSWEWQGAEMAAEAAKLAALGYRLRRVDRAEMARLEPGLTGLPEEALLFEDEAVAETADVTRALLQMACGLGAKLVTGARVSAVTETAGRVTGVETSLGRFAGTRVILANALGAPALVARFGLALPMAHRPAFLVTSAPLPPVIARVIATPEQEIRQLPCGRILAPGVASHQGSAGDLPEDLPAAAHAAMARVAAVLPAAEGLTWEGVALGLRPVPEDGLPVIGGFGPVGLDLAVMHSGVTLAALVGDLMINTPQSPLITAYDPSRFSAN